MDPGLQDGGASCNHLPRRNLSLIFELNMIVDGSTRWKTADLVSYPASVATWERRQCTLLEYVVMVDIFRINYLKKRLREIKLSIVSNCDLGFTALRLKLNI